MLVRHVISGVVAEVSDDAKEELGVDWVKAEGDGPKRTRTTAPKGE